MSNNSISEDTRRKISDLLVVSKIWYNGNIDELDFLSRLYNLKELPSSDSRYKNAFNDINQHTVNFFDWKDDWVFYDSRFNLMNCKDEEYLKFLIETLHPRVRSDIEQIEKLFKIYNDNLKKSGWEIQKSNEYDTFPEYIYVRNGIGSIITSENLSSIKNHFNSEYVNNKVELIQKSLIENSELAIGNAKELIETICTSILKTKSIEMDRSWPLSKLFKTTVSSLNFSQKELSNSDEFEKSLKQMLNGLSSIIQSISEIRNNFGTGHGKSPEFKQIDYKYAKLIVGIVTEISVFLLAIENEEKELIDKENDDIPF